MKTESKHTPGPWEAYGLAIYTESPRAHWVSGRDALQSLIAIARDNCGEDPEDVADNPPSFAEAEANARLISSAPELLEALERLADIAEGDGMDFSRDIEDVRIVAVRGVFLTLAASARAAIAKARGTEGGAK